MADSFLFCFLLPWSVLRSVPWAVRVILLDDAGFLLDDFCFGTGAGHGRTEEHVDDEHNQEEDAESDAQIEQPQRLDARTSCYRHCIRQWRNQRGRRWRKLEKCFFFSFFVCFSFLFLLLFSPNVTLSLSLFSVSCFYCVTFWYEHCPNGPCELLFTSHLVLATNGRFQPDVTLRMRVKWRLLTSGENEEKKKKRIRNEDYVEQLPDRRRRRCRRPSGSPPSRARRGQWLDPGRRESRRRRRTPRRTRLLCSRFTKKRH